MITKDRAREIAVAENERRGVECQPPHSVWGVFRYLVAADTEQIGSTVFVRISRRTGRVLGWRNSRWPRAMRRRRSLSR